MNADALTQRIRRLRDAVDAGTLLFVTRLNIFGLGLMVLWTAVNTVVLPMRVADTAPGGVEGSALGLISFIGVGFAVLVQPLAGRASDAWTLGDPRRPFIIAGIALIMPGLLLFGAASTFVVLVLGFVLMQLATNVSQAAFQAFIPDHVPEAQRGIASGAKNMLSVVGAAAGLIGAQGIRAAGGSNGWVLAYLGGVLVLTGLLTLRWVPRVDPTDHHGGLSLTDAVNPRRVWRDAAEILRQHPTFRLAIVAQFLYMLGANPAQKYLLLFLNDRFGSDAESRAALGAAGAIGIAVVAAVAAGKLSDAVGRLPVLIGTVILGAVGLALIGFSPTLAVVGIAGSMVAMGFGAFQAVNWALLNDDLPEGQAATALGVANIATAGAGAIAGVYGPVVDVLNARFPQGTYEIVYGMAGIVALAALLPLWRVRQRA